MQIPLYHSHVLRYLHLSRQLPKNVHDCARIKAARLILVPRQDTRPLGSSGGLLSAIAGSVPSCSSRYNKRYRESYLSGSKVTLRRVLAVNTLSSINTFVFYRTVNFRGFSKSPCNVTVGYRLSSLSFFSAASRAYDNGLLGFDDDSLDVFLNVSVSVPYAAPFILRGLRVPVYG